MISAASLALGISLKPSSDFHFLYLISGFLVLEFVSELVPTRLTTDW